MTFGDVFGDWRRWRLDHKDLVFISELFNPADSLSALCLRITDLCSHHQMDSGLQGSPRSTCNFWNHICCKTFFESRGHGAVTFVYFHSYIRLHFPVCVNTGWLFEILKAGTTIPHPPLATKTKRPQTNQCSQSVTTQQWICVCLYSLVCAQSFWSGTCVRIHRTHAFFLPLSLSADELTQLFIQKTGGRWKDVLA